MKYAIVLPSGRPGRGPLVNAGRVGQVPRVALLGRDGDDLAAELDDGPRPARRDADVADVLRPLGEPRPGLHEVGGDADPEPLRLGRVGFEGVQVPGLLEDDRPGPGADVQDREIGEAGELLRLLAAGSNENMLYSPLRSDRKNSRLPIHCGSRSLHRSFGCGISTVSWSLTE